jgi:hypothetical protein
MTTLNSKAKTLAAAFAQKAVNLDVNQMDPILAGKFKALTIASIEVFMTPCAGDGKVPKPRTHRRKVQFDCATTDTIGHHAPCMKKVHARGLVKLWRKVGTKAFCADEYNEIMAQSATELGVDIAKELIPTMRNHDMLPQVGHVLRVSEDRQRGRAGAVAKKFALAPDITTKIAERRLKDVPDGTPKTEFIFVAKSVRNAARPVAKA